MANSDFYPFESSFEVSDFTEWTSTTDTESKLTNDHYVKLIKSLGVFSGVAPYSGAYCGHINLALGTADAYAETTVVTAALGATIWIRFLLQVTSNIVMATSNRFTVMTLQSVVPTDMATVSILNNAGTLQLVAALTGATAVGATTRQAEFARDAWHTVEIGTTVDTGAADGTLQFWLDGYQVGTTVTGLTQSAITQMRLGAIGIDAGTTAGHLLFDSVVQTATHAPSHHARYPQVVVLTKSGFVALGPGRVKEYALSSGGAADNHLSIHDLDRQTLLSTSDMMGPELANNSPYEMVMYQCKRGGYFNRGVYVRLTGTAPRATIVLGDAQVGWGLIRQYALKIS